MKKYYLLIISFLILSCKEEVKNKNIVYLSPDCGCCHDWISHMESNNFSLEKNISQWSKSQSGDEKELDELLSRQLSRDSDLWIVEIESRQGNAYLDDI